MQQTVSTPNWAEMSPREIDDVILNMPVGARIASLPWDIGEKYMRGNVIRFNLWPEVLTGYITLQYEKIPQEGGSFVWERNECKQ